VLLLSSLLAVFFGANYLRAHRPEMYKPGEDLADVTHSLDRDATPAASSALPASGLNSAASLRKLDRQLPAGAPEPRFTDVTRQAGLAAFRSFAGNRTAQLPEDMGSGVAWGDFDNDGNDDLFVVSAGGPLDAPVSQLAPSLRSGSAMGPL